MQPDKNRATDAVDEGEIEIAVRLLEIGKAPGVIFEITAFLEVAGDNQSLEFVGSGRS
jgi:hypothetical protein